MVKEQIKNWILFWFSVFLTILFLNFTYALISNAWTNPNILEVTPATKLTADNWNKLLWNFEFLKSKTENIYSNWWNVGIWVENPTNKLEIDWNLQVNGLINYQRFWESFYSRMPNNMSFLPWWYIDGSITAWMSIWLYYYNLYWCWGQNNFTSWAIWNVVLVTGSWTSLGTNYFDNTNIWWWSCWNFRSWFIQVTQNNTTIKFRITWYDGWSNNDLNPGANSFGVHFYKIF